MNPHALDKAFECQKFTASIMWQLHEGMFFSFRKRVCWSLVIRMLYRWIPIAIFSYLFSMFFVPRYTPFADRARSHAMFTMCDGNHQWCNVNPMWKNDELRLLGLNLGLSRDVCEPMVGSAVKDSWWTNQEELFCPLSRKTRRVCNGCFILMHYRC